MLCLILCSAPRLPLMKSLERNGNGKEGKTLTKSDRLWPIILYFKSFLCLFIHLFLSIPSKVSSFIYFISWKKIVQFLDFFLTEKLVQIGWCSFLGTWRGLWVILIIFGSKCTFSYILDDKISSMICIYLHILVQFTITILDNFGRIVIHQDKYTWRYNQLIHIFMMEGGKWTI